MAESGKPSVLKKLSDLLNSDKGLNGTFGAIDPDATGVEEFEDDGYEFQNKDLLPATSTEDPDVSKVVALKDLMPRGYRNDPGANKKVKTKSVAQFVICLLYTSPSPRDRQKSRMPSSA